MFTKSSTGEARDIIHGLFPSAATGFLCNLVGLTIPTASLDEVGHNMVKDTAQPPRYVAEKQDRLASEADSPPSSPARGTPAGPQQHRRRQQ
ncbi:unnamed protein product, partial [Bubo scandiacus]